MDSQTKAKTVNLEDLQASSQQVLNKGLGNEGVCSTAASTAAKAVTLGTTFELVSGATVVVTFTNGISVANATLAVTHTPIGGSSTTESAKPIYYKGSALGADLVKAGAKVLLRYNGTQFDVIGDLNDNDYNGVYVGAAVDVSGAMVPANLHETLAKGEKVSVTASSKYLFIAIPSTTIPTVLMSGITVPTTQQSDVTVGTTTYKVLKSNVAYTGTFDVILL